MTDLKPTFNGSRPCLRTLWRYAVVTLALSWCASANAAAPPAKLPTVDPFNLGGPPPPCTSALARAPATRDPAAKRLYDESRALWRGKTVDQVSAAEAGSLLRQVGRAASLGDWPAREFLVELLSAGLADDNRDALRPLGQVFSEIQKAEAVAATVAHQGALEGQPWGWYCLAVAHDEGRGGLPKNHARAMAYHQHAARLGSPDSQMALAGVYGAARRWPEQQAMTSCAYQQGHGPAAHVLALRAADRKRYSEAVHLYQQGVKFGSAVCAQALHILFQQGAWGYDFDAELKGLEALGIVPDPERERRYGAIVDALQSDPDLRFGRLDALLPLPPAPLPAWPGVAAVADPRPAAAPRKGR